MNRFLAAIAAALPPLLLGAGPPAAAAPILHEVYYDAVGSDDAQVFVELAGEPGEGLDGLVLEGINGADGRVTVSIALIGVVPADGLFVVADRDADGATLVAGADLLVDFDLQNGPDGVVLRGPDGVLDALGYGRFDAGTVFPGEGSAAPDAAAGESLARLPGAPDRDDNAVDWVVGAPTPGARPVPEPGLAALAFGAIALGLARRRR